VLASIDIRANDMLEQLFANPLFGFSGNMASILGFPIGITGIVLAIYFYRRQSKRRGLSYKVHLVRTQIVKTGTVSRLAVLHDGQEIKSDITAAHITIWNQGREAIRRADILRPLIIETSDHSPILEATIQKVTHDVVGLSLDESQGHLGKLVVSWDILEERDSGIIQLTYAGPPSLPITAHAVLEGHRAIVDCSTDHIMPPVPGIEKAIYYFMFCTLGFVVIELWRDVAQLFRISPFSDKYPPWEGWGDWRLWLLGFATILLIPTIVNTIRILARLRRLRPPFDL
jgi:hypothetical protein